MRTGRTEQEEPMTTQTCEPDRIKAKGSEELIELVPDLQAEEMDERLRRADRRTEVGHRELAFYLAEMQERGLHQMLGYSSAIEYACKRLEMGRRHAQELIVVGRALNELPLVDEAFCEARIRWSRVRLLVRIAVPETERAWLERCARAVVERIRPRGRDLGARQAAAEGPEGTPARAHRRAGTPRARRIRDVGGREDEDRRRTRRAHDRRRLHVVRREPRPRDDAERREHQPRAHRRLDLPHRRPEVPGLRTAPRPHGRGARGDRPDDRRVHRVRRAVADARGRSRPREQDAARAAAQGPHPRRTRVPRVPTAASSSWRTTSSGPPTAARRRRRT